jgi:hypothetical protein
MMLVAAIAVIRVHAGVLQPKARPFPDRRGIEPPHGFGVMTGAELDDEHGRPDRWAGARASGRVQDAQGSVPSRVAGLR